MVLTDFLTGIADAIREKKGTSDPINAQDFADEIRGLSAGGGDNLLAKYMDGTKTEITESDLAGVTTLRASAFRGNVVLTKISMPDTITSIGLNLCDGCSALKEVKFSSNLGAILGYAFTGCSNLLEVNLANTKANDIGIYAFNNCKALKKVVVGERLKSIGAGAFNSANSLDVLDCRKSTTIISLSNANAFTSVPSTCKVIIPDNLYDSWISSTNWSALTVTYVKASGYTEA